jgi:hypothetical protein
MQRAGRGGYTVDKVARILQFHPGSVRVGELPSEPVDGRGESLIRPADLAAFMRECDTPGFDAPGRESRREAISAPLVNPAASAS